MNIQTYLSTRKPSNATLIKKHRGHPKPTPLPNHPKKSQPHKPVKHHRKHQNR